LIATGYHIRWMPIELTERKGGFALAVKVVPGSSRDRLAGEYGGGLKINVAAPPQDGRATVSVVRLLADALDTSISNIDITHGHTSPKKQLLIRGLDAQTIRDRLQERKP